MPVSMTRRRALFGFAGVSAGVGLAACSRATPSSAPGSAITIASHGARPNGTVRAIKLVAQPVDMDLGGGSVRTWAYGNSVPGRGLRATAGDRMQIEVTNRLPVPTSVHWHGMAIPNDMDGVPGVTTPELAPGASFTYDFVVPDAGTHWFHPHSGLQLDTGLYAPFIIDDPADPGRYDSEWIVVLDDWTDGIGPSPDVIFAELTAGNATANSGGMEMGRMDMGGSGGSGGMDGGDVTYPDYLINGRVITDPQTFTGKPGERVRIRMINAASDTIFTVALDGHDLQITHTDGYPVAPRRASSVRIGMGERYDLMVTLQDGVFPLVAMPMGKTGLARALIRTGAGPVPSQRYVPSEMNGQPATVADLRGDPASALPAKDPDSIQDVVLNGSMSPYRWTINGERYADMTPLTIRSGQSGRLRFRNMTMMSHPMHLHGHSFQLGAAGGRGPRKDTVLVPPMGAVDVAFVADNPGLWMVHCHNAYHAEAGMMTRLDYVS